MDNTDTERSSIKITWIGKNGIVYKLRKSDHGSILSWEDRGAHISMAYGSEVGPLVDRLFVLNDMVLEYE